MKQNRLKIISAKDLGDLNLPDFCPRCFWLERHISKPPSIFPGIFSTIDSATKKSTHRSFAEKNQTPGWLPTSGLVEVVEEDIYFKYPTGINDWILTGQPDDIFKTKDNSYCIVDYKTAKFTKHQDELFPLYEVQLNAYAFLAEKYGFEPISKLLLVYCQPNGELETDDDFKLGFKIYQLEVEINLDIIPELLLKARQILNQDSLPEPAKNCKGICQWLLNVQDVIIEE